MTDQLRYADAPSTEVSRVIAATPEAIWALVSDINLPAKFSTEFKGAEWLDGATEPAVGARFQGTNVHPVADMKWNSECTITACEPSRHIAWEVAGGGGPAANWSFTLEEVDGGTLVTQYCSIGPGKSGLSPAIEKMPEKEHQIIERRLKEHADNMKRNLDGIASLI